MFVRQERAENSPATLVGSKLVGRFSVAAAYSNNKGGPSSSMPWARHSPGSCGGIALDLVTSRKKAFIFPAGINAIRILPRA